MRRRIRKYTPLGWRIASLDKRQVALAKTLRISQQTISKKLRGETAILVSDLQKLSKHYGVPLTYFFEEGPDDPELRKSWERIRRSPGPAREIAVLVSRLSSSKAQKVLQIVRAAVSRE
ncbi:MAG: helix-turn-helix transcriptional regulator [Planctomycetota bacterium]|jgi:transcriptional regulator with XRE-family HTH domain